MTTVCVVVFGDLARSPRMLNHCISLSELPSVARIELVGYAESELLGEVTQCAKVRQHIMAPVFRSSSSSSLLQRYFLVRALVKIVLQTWTLLHLLLFAIDRPDFILMQVCVFLLTSAHKLTFAPESAVDSGDGVGLVLVSAATIQDDCRLAQLRLHVARHWLARRRVEFVGASIGNASHCRFGSRV